jgi:site-specific DNA recombinase
MNKVRCAIYTRKSSEEGLEQDFNSLHAQREACSAYVLSQASEGWSALPEVYDDGGISGGTLERPALKRLLDDIDAGRIDIVVVYKVDRLTRSLLDFSKLVEAFDKAGVSFVSVTQSFNTTTSMGRLTLNMLLSFAQFEREVTAERIRDKIAASKARGMWMGGTPPLGYRPDGRSLAIVDQHAALVRRIFESYLALGSVRAVASDLFAHDICVPERTAMTGRSMGGREFTRGQIHKILANPTYVSEIHHRGKVHKGNHQPIIDRDTWVAVQHLLASNAQGDQPCAHVQTRSLLAGRLLDESGEPLVATHATKGKVRYRYYVSKALQHDPDADSTDGMRIPAKEIETAAVNRIAESLDDPLALVSNIGIPLEVDEIRGIMGRAEKLATQVRDKDYTVVRDLLAKITVGPRAIDIELRTEHLAKALRLTAPAGALPTIKLTSQVRLTRTGLAVRLIHTNGRAATDGTPDPALVNLLVLARRWWERLATGETDIATLARSEGVNDSWVTRVVRLNFLAPQIVGAILEGTQPATLNATTLVSAELALDWNLQVDAMIAA